MNNSSSLQPNAPKRAPPPPGAPPLRRTKPAADPLVARKKRGPKPALSRPPPKPSPASGQNRINAPTGRAPKEPSFGPGSSKDEERLKAFEAKRAANGGWSQNPPVEDFKEYPLVTTKRALREGLRHHIMRFNRAKDDKPADPTDQDQFPRPVSLHRRDPRQPPAGRMMDIKDELPPLNPADEADAERLRQLKAEREAQRAIDMAQIAPIAKPNDPKPTKQVKKEKAFSTYRPTQTDETKKQQELRYEETLPWHLEDVEGKNVWVGSYVAALSEVNVALVISGGGFRMIPLERYYRFNAKPAFQRFSLEEAEKMMGKNANEVGRWVMKDKERAEADKEYQDYRKFLGGPARVKIENSNAIPKSERTDDHDLDMSGDEFQDDDEAPGFEADDEDARDARERVRRDHLGANNFGEVEEEEVDKEEEIEKLEKMREKVQGKRIRRNLTRLERAMEYSSDSDSDNPFAESSSESEDEKEKENEDKKEEDGKDGKDGKDVKKQGDEKEKPASGANTKGNTTPSGKHKASDMKKIKSLKRPGSPNLSESSGNESSRKKKVKKTKAAATASLNASRATTPLPGRTKMAGATSDGEATAGEGSDGGLKPKKIKLKTSTGAKGTPTGSRAGSPVPLGNKPNSPSKADTPRGSPAPGSPTGPVQAWEIAQALEARPEGISLGELLRMFSHRVESEKHPHLMKRQEWIALVRQNASYGPDKLVRPKANPGA